MTTHSMVAHAFRRLVVPLACYYAVTLGLPLANGAAHSGAAFLNHAVFVLLIPPTLIVLLCAIQKAALLFAGACRSAPRAVFSPFRDYPHVYSPLLQVAERDPLGESAERDDDARERPARAAFRDATRNHGAGRCRSDVARSSGGLLEAASSRRSSAAGMRPTS